jgi:hypothetical protein
MRAILCLLFILTVPFSNVFASSPLFKDIIPNEKDEYYLRLKNGDELSGFIIEIIDNKEDGEGIRFKTEVGKALVYDFQIAELRLKSEMYRHTNRLYFMNTAEPINNNHFIGNFELLFLYGGIGLADLASINFGSSLIPGQNNDQLTTLNIKLTVLNEPFESMDGKMVLAIGSNYAHINKGTEFLHFYGVSTFTGRRSNLSIGLFYKAGMNDLGEVKVFDRIYGFNYGNGSFGLNLGLDTKFSERNDLHFIGELWNSDISKPTNTGILIGLRLTNTKFSTDFGLALFTQPFIAPFFSFVWTPF